MVRQDTMVGQGLAVGQETNQTSGPIVSHVRCELQML